jgi:hypothetical protein
LVISCYHTLADRKGEGDLLVHLKTDAYKRISQQYFAYGFLLGIFKESAKQKTDKCGHDNEAYVKYTVRRGDRHRQIVKLDEDLK